MPALQRTHLVRIGFFLIIPFLFFVTITISSTSGVCSRFTGGPRLFRLASRALAAISKGILALRLGPACGEEVAYGEYNIFGVVGVVDAFLYDGLFVGVEFGVGVGVATGDGDGERFWIEVDLDNRDGGWANAGKDFRVDRARGDCDMTTDLQYLLSLSVLYGIQCPKNEYGGGKENQNHDARRAGISLDDE
jgi:hypothetical protein